MAGDPNWGSVVLLLHGRGADGSTAIVDSSPTARALNVTGDAKIRTAQSKFNGSSIYLDGAGDCLIVPHDAVLSPSGKEFTMEVFVYPETTAAVKALFTKRDGIAGEFGAYVQAGGAVNVFSINGSGVTVVSATTAAGAVQPNVWSHIAFTRSAAGTWRVFVNGVKSAEAVESSAMTSNASSLMVGRDSTNLARDFQGFLAEARITSGVDRYAGANFAVPTSAYPDGRGQVSGTVKSVGVGVARTVRAYRRDTGALVANTASDAGGNYSFYTPTLDEVSVICLDDAAGTVENDLVLRAIPA